MVVSIIPKSVASIEKLNTMNINKTQRYLYVQTIKEYNQHHDTVVQIHNDHISSRRKVPVEPSGENLLCQLLAGLAI